MVIGFSIVGVWGWRRRLCREMVVEAGEGEVVRKLEGW